MRRIHHTPHLPSSAGLKQAGWRDRAKGVNLSVVAVCVVMIACAGIFSIQRQANRDAYKMSAVPGVTIDGVTFIESGWDTADAECPGGFVYGGTVETTTDSGEYLAGCEYYMHPDIPEWVYIHGPVCDASHNACMAYERFVLPDIRYNFSIRYDGRRYVNLFDYTGGGDDPREFDQYKSGLAQRYGYRVETDVPEGCTLVGRARMEELDRIPRVDLGVNHPDYGGAAVYADPEDSGVLYVGASWHTATEEGAGETLHTGYAVFVLHAPDEA